MCREEFRVAVKQAAAPETREGLEEEQIMERLNSTFLFYFFWGGVYVSMCVCVWFSGVIPNTEVKNMLKKKRVFSLDVTAFTSRLFLYSDGKYFTNAFQLKKILPTLDW